MKRIAHISDIHFGRVVPEIADALVADLKALNPDLVAVSGDLTQRARPWQYRAARDFLRRIPFPKIVVPGNHDVPLYDVGRRFLRPLKRFERYITNDFSPFYADDEIAVLGVNTARSFTFTNGSISAKQVEIIREHFCGIPQETRKILVTHHPFLPPPDDLKRRLMGSAGKVLTTLESCNLDLLLAGHFHMSYAGGSHSVYRTLARSVLVIQAGTATSSRVRKEKNAYNTISVEGDQVELEVRMWEGRGFVHYRKQRFHHDDERGWDLGHAPHSTADPSQHLSKSGDGIEENLEHISLQARREFR